MIDQREFHKHINYLVFIICLMCLNENDNKFKTIISDLSDKKDKIRFK
jgi:hypothetical protein